MYNGSFATFGPSVAPTAVPADTNAMVLLVTTLLLSINLFFIVTKVFMCQRVRLEEDPTPACWLQAVLFCNGLGLLTLVVSRFSSDDLTTIPITTYSLLPIVAFSALALQIIFLTGIVRGGYANNVDCLAFNRRHSTNTTAALYGVALNCVAFWTVVGTMILGSYLYVYFAMAITLLQLVITVGKKVKDSCDTSLEDPLELATRVV